MKKIRQRGDIQSRSTYAGPAIVAAIFLGLHLLPLVWRPNPLWGVDFLLYLPSPIQALFAFLAVLLFIPGFRRQIRSRLGALPFAIWGRGQRVRITRALILLVALAAFIAFASARHFLGDGYYLIETLESATWKKHNRAPLTFNLLRALHSVGRAFWESSENTYRIFSYASGVLYIVLAFAMSAALGKNALQKSIVLVVMLSAGYMQLFFGYVENYAVYMPGLILYLLLGLRTMEQRMPPYVPALLLGVLLALHQGFAVFAPSLLFLAYRTYRHRQEIAPIWKNAALSLLALCCVPVSTAAFLWLSGVDFEAYLMGPGGGDFLPLFADPGLVAQYRIFSFAHVLDFLNQQLLSAPAACMVFFLLRRNDLRHQPFLAVCSAVPLLFTFIANPQIGAYRDWDIFSLPAVPLTLWTASAFLNRIGDRKQVYHAAFVLCGAAVLHSSLWIAVNANAGASEARYVHHLNRLTGWGSVNGWIMMGKYHHQKEGNNTAAHQAFRRAIDADPTNPNRWLTAGALCRQIGMYANAIEYYNKAVELVPDNPIPYMNLGVVHSDLRQFDNAIEYTRKAIALDPDLVTAHLNLGLMYRRVGKLAEAISALEKAAQSRPQDANIQENLAEMYKDRGESDKAIHHLERANSLRPRNVRNLVNLAIAYAEVGQHGRAIELLKVAVALQPEFAKVHMNLGVTYNRIGQYDTGIQYLNKALEIEPDNPHAIMNLGLVYRSQGRHAEAITQFTKALELQGANAKATAYLNVGDTYYDMGEHEKAIPYFHNAIRLNPNHANAHLLLGLSYRALKRGDEARAYFEKTLELEPDHPQAEQIRRWLGRSEE